MVEGVFEIFCRPDSMIIKSNIIFHYQKKTLTALRTIDGNGSCMPAVVQSFGFKVKN
jgi:hypothetical protein